MDIDEVIKKTVDGWWTQEEEPEPVSSEPSSEEQGNEPESDGDEDDIGSEPSQPDPDAAHVDNDPVQHDEPPQPEQPDIYDTPENSPDVEPTEEPEAPDAEEPELMQSPQDESVSESTDGVGFTEPDNPEENLYPDFDQPVAPAGEDTEPEQNESGPEGEMPEISEPDPPNQEQEDSLKQEIENTPRNLTSSGMRVGKEESEPQGLNLNVTMGLEDGVAEQIANQVAPHLDRLQLTIQHHIEDAISLKETEIGLMGLGNE